MEKQREHCTASPGAQAGYQARLAGSTLLQIVDFLGPDLGAVLVGPDGRLRAANPAARVLLGLGTQDVDIEVHDRVVALCAGQTPTAMLALAMGAPDETELYLLWDKGTVARLPKHRSRGQLVGWAERLLAQLSHEVRNPLATLTSGLYLLALDEHLSEESRVIVENCRAECEHMTGRMNEAVRVLRRRDIAPGPCLLGELVSAALEERRASAAGVGVVLEESSSGDPCRVIGDPLALSFVIGRLLDDAIAATPRGGKIRVVLGRLSAEELALRFAGPGGDVFSLRIGDGNGAPAAALDPITVPGKPARGVELAQAVTLLECHGGMVLPLAQPGATYEILMPAGDRPTCWVWKTDRRETACSACANCPASHSLLGACCWAARGRASYDQTDEWPEACRDCSYFQRFHLVGRLGRGRGGGL